MPRLYASLLCLSLVACRTSDAEGESSSSSVGASETDGSTDTSGDDDGEPPPRVATMQVYLADAMARARELDPDAALLRVRGFSVRSDGTIDLEGTAPAARRWNISFESPSGYIIIYYVSQDQAETNDYPEIDYPSVNVQPGAPIAAPDALPDSDLVASAFEAETGCGILDEADGVQFIYEYRADLGGDVILVGSDGTTWTALLPDLTVVDSCL